MTIEASTRCRPVVEGNISSPAVDCPTFEAGRIYVQSSLLTHPPSPAHRPLRLR